jgi:hypothetical protein
MAYQKSINVDSLIMPQKRRTRPPKASTLKVFLINGRKVNGGFIPLRNRWHKKGTRSDECGGTKTDFSLVD